MVDVQIVIVEYTEITIKNIVVTVKNHLNGGKMRIELHYNLNGLEICQTLHATPQTYKLLVNQAISEIVRKYNVQESEIRVVK